MAYFLLTVAVAVALALFLRWRNASRSATALRSQLTAHQAAAAQEAERLREELSALTARVA